VKARLPGSLRQCFVRVCFQCYTNPRYVQPCNSEECRRGPLYHLSLLQRHVRYDPDPYGGLPWLEDLEPLPPQAYYVEEFACRKHVPRCTFCAYPVELVDRGYCRCDNSLCTACRTLTSLMVASLSTAAGSEWPPLCVCCATQMPEHLPPPTWLRQYQGRVQGHVADVLRHRDVARLVMDYWAYV